MSFEKWQRGSWVYQTVNCKGWFNFQECDQEVLGDWPQSLWDTFANGNHICSFSINNVSAANECAFLGRRQIALFLWVHSAFSLPFFWPNCLFMTGVSLDPSSQSAHSFHASASSRLSSNYMLGLICPTVIDQYVSLNKWQ